MFRDSTAENVKDSLTDQYNKWREQTLKNPPSQPFDITASFGIPEPLMYTDEDGNRKVIEGASTSVEEAGLITSNDLLQDPVMRKKVLILMRHNVCLPI
jgi:hypothetical protein